MTQAWSRHAIGMLVMVAAALLPFGCVAEPPLCYEAEYRACSCDGRAGYQLCAQGQYGACDCDRGTPGLTSGTGGTGQGGAGQGGAGQGGEALLAYLQPCMEDEECETGLCYPFNAKGPHCTTPCDQDRDCAPPSPGCSNKKVCKVP